MSETLQDSEHASPLVRSQSEAILEDRHGATPAPHAGHAGDEPDLPPSYVRSKTFTALASLDAFNHQNLQLSERDSIFATTYHPTESNAATPQQRPRRDSKHDPSHDVTTKLQLPPPLLSRGGASSSTSKARPSSAVTPLSVLTKQLHQFDSIGGYSGRSQDGGGLGSVYNPNGSFEQRNSEAIKSKLAHPSLFDTNSCSQKQIQLQNAHYSQVSSMRGPSKQAKRNSAMSSTRDRKVTAASGSTQASATDKESIAVEEGRAQRIEATIASDEPISHARSRKASHYLGIFREKEGLQSRKRSKEKESDTAVGDDGTAQVFTSISDNVDNDIPEGNLLEALDGNMLEMNSHGYLRKTSRPQGPAGSPTISRSSTQATTVVPSLFSERSSLAKSSEDETSSLEEEHSVGVVESSIEWRSGEQGQGSLPLRLLEEIRDHRRKKDHKPTTSQKTQDSRVAHDSARAPALTEHDNQSHSRSFTSSGERPEDDEEDSDKERISSATYYPHHAPSPDTIAEHHHLDQTQLEQECSTFSQLPPKALDAEFEGVKISGALPASTHPSRASISESLVRKERQLRSPATDVHNKYESGWSATSSASDTDYESVDDLIRSDQEYDLGGLQEGEITPTATPHAYSYFRAQPKRGRKPLQAVKLQPYKHQVGGHTKVFSFSRRAICKQLNNRENVFYEVIERSHPQLLQFLPK